MSVAEDVGVWGVGVVQAGPLLPWRLGASGRKGQSEESSPRKAGQWGWRVR